MAFQTLSFPSPVFHQAMLGNLPDKMEKVTKILIDPWKERTAA